MGRMKKLRLSAIIAGILTVGGFIVLAVGGTELPVQITLISLAVFLGGGIASLVIVNKRSELSAQIQASMPVVNEMATIASRRVRHGYRLGMRGGHVSSTDIWCLTFETSKHGAVELAVPWEVWERYPDGVRGELRYKGRQFIRFMKR